MNKAGGIGATINIIFVILVAIAVLAVISPVTSSMFQDASDTANLSGFEALVVENFNVILLLFFTLLLFITMYIIRGGGGF